jgi:hypothetical protein
VDGSAALVECGLKIAVDCSLWGLSVRRGERVQVLQLNVLSSFASIDQLRAITSARSMSF